MKYVYSSSQTYELEDYTINTLGIPAVVLMERAALALFDVIIKKYPCNKSRICIVAGKGNNGADALALARLLINSNYNTKIFIIDEDKNKCSTLFSLQLNILKNMDCRYTVITDTTPLNNYDLIVDGLIGIGLNNDVNGYYAAIINNINNSKISILSIDIPSGLIASSSKAPLICIKSDICVTFNNKKVCHALTPAKKYCGDIFVYDIGIIGNRKISHTLVEPSVYALPSRDKYAHKGTYGFSLHIGGSSGMYGAVILSGMASIKSGTGKVAILLPSNDNSFSAQYPQLMVQITNNTDFFTKADIKKTFSLLHKKSAISIGNGIGKDEQTQEYIREILFAIDIPLVMDADALTVLKNNKIPETLHYKCVITPHIGEFAYILGITKDILESDKLKYVKDYAMDHKIYVVLKSAETLITTPYGEQYVTDFGTPALAKGGSGDVLSGIITSLIAQGFDILKACISSMYMLGEASKICTKNRSEFSISPTDLIESIGVNIR